MIRTISAVIFAVLSAGMVMAQEPDELQGKERVEAIFQQIDGEDYTAPAVQSALAELETIEHPAALAGKAMLYQFELEDTEAVGHVLEGLVEIAPHDNYLAPRFLLPEDADLDATHADLYDGSGASFTTSLLGLRGLGSVESPWGRDLGPGFTLPCEFFKRHPELGRLTAGLQTNHRWSVPAFPIQCADIESMSNVNAFWKQARYIAPNPTNCGTIYRDRAAGLRINFDVGLYQPQSFRIYPEDAPTEFTDTTLFAWALSGRSNYRTFKKLETLFNAGREELVAYYVMVFNIEPERAHTIASHFLMSQVIRNHFAPASSRSQAASLEGERELRAVILAGEPVLATDLPNPDHVDGEPDFSELRDGSKIFYIPMSGWPEPLIHLALARPETLAVFLRRGFDPDTRDVLGKTTLMAAVQDNNLPAVKQLLAAGADINAVSARPEDIPGNSDSNAPYSCTGAYTVSTGARTPLMYGLLEGDEDLVSYLVENGADLSATDSAGNTLADYIQGNGPATISPKLSEGFKAKLLKTLDN